MNVPSPACAPRPRCSADKNERRPRLGVNSPGSGREFLRHGEIAASVATLLLALATVTTKGADPLDTWTSADTGTQNGLLAATFANGQFLAVGAGGTIVSSTDGVTWTPRSSGTSSLLTGIAYGGGRYVAVGNDGTATTAEILNSPDATKWTPADAAMANALVSVAYGNGRFVAVGIAPSLSGRSAAAFSSLDGLNWTPWKVPWPNELSTTGAPALNGVAYGNGVFVAVFRGSHLVSPPSRAVTSIDGETWVEVPVPPYDVAAVTFGNGQFVAAGGYLGGPDPTPVNHGVVYSSVDGTNWIRRLDNVGGQFYSIGYGGGAFVVGTSDGIFSSSDLTNWKGQRTGVYGSGIAYGNGQFITVGGGATVARSGVIGKLGASLSPSGQFLGTITGVSGQKFAIETSTNLGTWMDLTSVTVSNGLARFGDPGTTNSTRRSNKAMTVKQ